MASRKRTTRASGSSRKKPPVDRATAYAQAVVSGEIVAGPHVRNACRRHLHDLKHAKKRGWIWNEPIGEESEPPLDRVFGFFREVLCLAGGQFEGVPFELEPAQAFIVGSLFAWRRKDGTRRFRRCYIEQGKGNGKSPLAAGIGMYGLTADRESRAEIYAAASKKDQAQVLFRDAVAMYAQSPKLKRRLTTSGVNPVWNLADLSTGSWFRPISSEDGHSGPRPHIALCDEVHEHRNRTVIEMLERGFKWRRQPLLVMITNSGSDRNSVCWEEHQHGIRVAAGTRDPDEQGTFVADLDFIGQPANDRSFSYVCALDVGDDPLTDPGCWIKANPLLGSLVTEEKLAEEVSKAKAIPGQANGILRLNFCVWTDAEQAWLSRATLESVLDDFDPRDHAGKRAALGVDLSGSKDLTALAFVVQTGTCQRTRAKTERGPDGRFVETGELEQVTLPTFDAWVEAWTPRDTLTERCASDQAPYDLWVRDGWLTAIDGRIIRLDYIAARIAEASSEYDIGLLAYDRYSYRHLERELDDLGVTVPQVEHPQGGKRRAKATDDQVHEAKMRGEEPPQGLWMPGSLSELESLILEERIRIRRSPVIISAVASAAIEEDAFSNRWFSKRRAVNRIDALVALAMAVGAAHSMPESTGAYEGRDLLVI